MTRKMAARVSGAATACGTVRMRSEYEQAERACHPTVFRQSSEKLWTLLGTFRGAEIYFAGTHCYAEISMQALRLNHSAAAAPPVDTAPAAAADAAAGNGRYLCVIMPMRI